MKIATGIFLALGITGCTALPQQQPQEYNYGFDMANSVYNETPQYDLNPIFHKKPLFK